MAYFCSQLEKATPGRNLRKRNAATCKKKLSRTYDLISCTYDLLSRTYDIISRTYEIISRTYNLLSRTYEIIFFYTWQHYASVCFNPIATRTILAAGLLYEQGRVCRCWCVDPSCSSPTAGLYTANP